MTLAHSKLLIRYLFQKDPSELPIKRFLFKTYLLVYLIVEILVGSRFCTKMLKFIRKIRLKTKIKNGCLMNHKLEQVPYLYDLQDSNEEICTGKNKIILDIGAHIGSFALKYAKNNRVYAFEPNKENYSFLLQNVKNNKLNKNIVAFNLAVSNKKGYKNLKLSDGSGGHSFYVRGKIFEKVKTTTIDTFIKKKKITRIDILKIDAEGEELNILIGAKRMLTKMFPLIIMDLHPWYVSSKKIIKKLKEFNYTIDSIDRLKIYASKNLSKS